MSALRIVERRWATTMEVRFFIRLSRASCTSFSDSVSSAEVASSRIMMGGFFNTARAMLKRWRCPPLNLPPRSPIQVSYPFSVCMINSWALAIRAARSTSSWVADSTPKAMLLKIVSLKRIGSWFTFPMSSRKPCNDTSLMLMPSIRISPLITS